MADAAFMEKLTALCKRRGFIFQSSEIYGGIGGFWDYGPLGVELKRNIKDRWWRDMVQNPPPGPDGREIAMVGVDCSIIMNPKVWEASGHATGFADPMVDDKVTKARYRADQFIGFYALATQPENGLGLKETYLELQRKLQEPDFLPQFTFVATSEGEGIDYFSRTLKKLFPYRAVREQQLEEEIAADLIVSVPNGRHLVVEVKRVPQTQLSDHYATIPAPETNQLGSLTAPRQFNLMFETFVGALQDASSKAFLRPETAQGIFANFKNVLDTSRVKLPFGIGQIGKAFRNEINPRNFIFRSREFEQMEIEFFCREEDSMDWYQFWRKTRFDWYVNLGLKSEKLRLRDQTAEELAHYSKACADIEYLFPFADEHQELEGVAHRGQFDLTQHSKHSGKDLSYFDDDAWQRDAAKFADNKDAATKAKAAPPYRFIPTVIEPSAGADRATLAFLCEAYTEDQAPDEKGAMQTRVLMKFHPKLAPIKAAIFPLVNKEGMPEIAETLYKDLKRHMPVMYDDGGAIGRRYRRQDEVGTPFCITVDGDTLTSGTVTIRDRDSLKQERVATGQVLDWLKSRMGE